MGMNWHKNFDERERKEIAFNRYYARHYGHGTDGHNARIIIAKMAELLDEAEARKVAEKAIVELKEREQ